MKIILIDRKGTSKQSDDYKLIIPVNPEKIKCKSEGRFLEYDIVNLGPANVPNGKELTQIAWESFFPGIDLKRQPYVISYTNANYLYKKIDSWRKNGTKLLLRITETPISMNVYIDSFEPTFDGPNGNINYSIGFIEAVDVSVEVMRMRLVQTRGTRLVTSQKKYRVVKGDCLWNISKRFYGKGSEWKKIYNANKSTIESAAKKHGRKSSSNGHWIYPGTILKIPL